MLSTVPWGVVRSALHVGRREGDAVWHRRSDRRIPPRRTVVKRSVISAQSSCVSLTGRAHQASAQTMAGTQEPSSRAARRRRQGPQAPRQRGRSAAQNLDGVEHRSTLTDVPVGPVRARSEGRADRRRKARRGRGSYAKPPEHGFAQAPHPSVFVREKNEERKKRRSLPVHQIGSGPG
jgi:hypothetical protein